jgi:hypothetical protein
MQATPKTGWVDGGEHIEREDFMRTHGGPALRVTVP